MTTFSVDLHPQQLDTPLDTQPLDHAALSSEQQDTFSAWLTAIAAAQQLREDLCMVIQGPLCSGKTQLLRWLAMLLQPHTLSAEVAAHFNLRGDKSKRLVIPVRFQQQSSLRAALFEAYQQHTPNAVSLSEEEQVFLQFEQSAAAGRGLQAALESLFQEGILPGSMFYRKLRHGNKEQRLKLASKIYQWQHKQEAEHSPDDFWLELGLGLARLAKHAQRDGYTQIVWLLDDILPWLRRMDQAERVAQLHTLQQLLYAAQPRALPYVTFFSLQDEVGVLDNLAEQLAAHASQRLQLTDEDVARIARQKLTQLPFRPKLIELASTAAQAFGDGPSPLQLLQELLDLQETSLASLWEILFSASSLKKLQSSPSPLARELLVAEHSAQALEATLTTLSVEHARPLRRLLRSALLLQTLGLLRQNSSDERPGLRTLLAENPDLCPEGVESVWATWADMLLALQNPSLQIVEDTEDVWVSVDLGARVVQQLVQEAREKVLPAQEQHVLRRILEEQLGLSSSGQGIYTLPWRGTRRSGLVRLGPLLGAESREQDFSPNHAAFLLLLSSPLLDDASSKQRSELMLLSRIRATAEHWTLAWLPAPLPSSARSSLKQLTAIDILQRDPRYKEWAPQLASRNTERKLLLEESIRQAYLQRSTRYALHEAIEQQLGDEREVKSLAQLCSTLLDARYPKHPRFAKQVSISDLETILGWACQEVHELSTEDEEFLYETIAAPLQIFAREGQLLRFQRTGIYAVLLQWLEGRSAWESHSLRARLVAEPFGLTRLVTDFFLLLLAKKETLELQEHGAQLQVDSLQHLPENFSLRREEQLASTLWQQACSVSDDLFGHAMPRQEQDPQAQAAHLTSLGRVLRVWRARINRYLVLQHAPKQGLSPISPVDTQSLLAIIERYLSEQSHRDQARTLAACLLLGNYDTLCMLKEYLLYNLSSASHLVAVPLPPPPQHLEVSEYFASEAEALAFVQKTLERFCQQAPQRFRLSLQLQEDSDVEA